MTPLGAEIARIIAIEGPMPVSRYMALCLQHPRRGYYVTRDPLGRDFVTAPEISQVFGELIGLWCADSWSRLGRPDPVALVELGPGRGTLMADLLRAARIVPAFRAALRVHLVETGPVLRERQRAALRDSGVPVAWHDGVAEVPEGPLIVVANEFLDALPVRQFVRAGGAWRERLVGLDSAGRLAFGLAPEPEPSLTPSGPDGAVIEVGAAAADLVAGLATRVVRHGGAILAIDYGHVRTGFGDTLQAVRAHASVDPLGTPGEADLTAHVDFPALSRAALAAGASVHGPVPQGAFLRALGIEARADALRRARPDAGAAIEAGIDRLVAGGATGMGALFKVLAIASPNASPLAGFDG